MRNIIRAFLCYSSSDRRIVLKVKKALEQHGIIIWFDEFQVGMGKSIRKEIDRGIVSSNFLILFMSKDSIKSEWVNRELDAAFMDEIETENTIVIPILLENCDVPPTLKMKRYIDFRKDHKAGIRMLIQALEFPRQSVLKALSGKWSGDSGKLFLSTVGDTIIGKYDWMDQKSGNLYGNLEQNRIKFNWSWDYTPEHGIGVFDLDETFQKLKGGWWLSTEKIDPDLSFEQLRNMKGFNLWEFNKDEIGQEAVFLYDALSRFLNSSVIYSAYTYRPSTDEVIRARYFAEQTSEKLKQFWSQNTDESPHEDEEQRDERKKLEILISKHKRRLQRLKEQEALQGISVDPKIPLEIEDIETKILKLQERLKNKFGKE